MTLIPLEDLVVHIAPIRAKMSRPWEGVCKKKPWNYRVTAVIPELDSPDELALGVELLRLQTERPYIVVIDTGSLPKNFAKVEAMRAPDLEVHAADAPKPWNTDGEGTAGKPTILEGGRLAWPIGFGSMAETGYLNALYAINGPFDVPPGGYGECSTDYPLPLLIDPKSFPIPEDEANPLGPQVPGTWQEYLEAWPGDIEGPPPCGFRSFIAPDGGWQPASFMADFLLWTVLYWDANPDGSIAKNRAIVMPFDGRAGAIPAGGSISVAFAETLAPSVKTPISDPVTIAQQGQYQLNFYGTLEIDALGVPVNVALQITWGPAWDEVDFTDSPMAAASIVNGQLPVSGETVTLTGAGRMLPKFTVDTQVNIQESGPYQDNDVVTVNTTINYEAFGFETLSFQYLLYFLPGDTIQLIATNAGTEDSAVQINGGLTYQRTNNNPFGTIAVYY